MLKTTIYKACFIVSSFIFMDMASGTGIDSGRPFTPVAATHRTIEHAFDSSGLCTCIPFSVNDNLAQAPRIKVNKNVAAFVKKYHKENGYFLDKAKAKVINRFTVIDSVFRELGMPAELKYLAFIESGMKYNAISWAGAVGPWALMPVAAKQYGLKVSRKNDERLDYNKSTHAAAALLSDLYDKYEDWLLVIAAYNSGPAWIDRAIKLSGSRNYWALQQFLPKETQKHIKKYIAVHYHFEGHGSLTTMTKAETAAHIKAVEQWVEKNKEMEEAPKMDSVSVVVSK